MVILNKAHPQVKVVRAVSECWNSLGGIGATKKSGCKMPKKKKKKGQFVQMDQHYVTWPKCTELISKLQPY